jgi:hypothetical protein
VIEVRPAGYNAFTLWEPGERGPEQVGRPVYTDYYSAAYDLGSLGRTMPADWQDYPRASQGLAAGMEMRAKLRIPEVERRARILENERWMHESPARVRLIVGMRLHHEWLHRLLTQGYGRIYQRIEHNPRLSKDDKAAKLVALRDRAIGLSKRRRRMRLEWLERHGCPWPNEMP